MVTTSLFLPERAMNATGGIKTPHMPCHSPPPDTATPLKYEYVTPTHIVKHTRQCGGFSSMRKEAPHDGTQVENSKHKLFSLDHFCLSKTMNLFIFYKSPD